MGNRGGAIRLLEKLRKSRWRLKVAGNGTEPPVPSRGSGGGGGAGPPVPSRGGGGGHFFRWSWPRVNLLSTWFLYEVLFRIVSALEGFVLVSSLCFFFLCCGCHF